MFLFLVVAEAFGALLSKAFQGGLMEGFEIGNDGVVVSHPQFTDDTIVMCKNLMIQLRYLHCVIRCFEAVSGLKVNLSQSCIYGVENMEDL